MTGRKSGSNSSRGSRHTSEVDSRQSLITVYCGKHPIHEKEKDKDNKDKDTSTSDSTLKELEERHKARQHRRKLLKDLALKEQKDNKKPEIQIPQVEMPETGWPSDPPKKEQPQALVLLPPPAPLLPLADLPLYPPPPELDWDLEFPELQLDRSFWNIPPPDYDEDHCVCPPAARAYDPNNVPSPHVVCLLPL